MHIKNLRHRELYIDELVTAPGESWCIFGGNLSGINRLLELLSGTLTHFSAENLVLENNPGILSFRAQQTLYEAEIRNDDTDFLDKIDPGTLVKEFIPDFSNHDELLKAFTMENCLELGYRQLSSGQARKLLLLRELTSGRTCLILENPYDGLDSRTCRELQETLRQLPERHIGVIIFVNTISDIPPWVSHLAVISNNRMTHAGKKSEILPLLPHCLAMPATTDEPLDAIYFSAQAPFPSGKEELVFLQNGFAGFSEKALFSGLNMTMYTGDHTLITGPNGCGKSTLLDIITGDSSQCYANDLRVFGKKRGTGESIWEIKKQMGIVSPSLHREHRIPGNALHVVLSGLHDSIGLYQKASTNEIQQARRWLTWLGLLNKAYVAFRQLSYAEQRLVLIARALIKRPKLLILDEPTQGLDDSNRTALLDFLEKAAERNLSTVLFVSHREDEHRPFFRSQIRLDSYC